MTINRRQDGARRGGGDGTVSFLFETIMGEGGSFSYWRDSGRFDSDEEGATDGAARPFTDTSGYLCCHGDPEAGRLLDLDPAQFSCRSTALSGGVRAAERHSARQTCALANGLILTVAHKPGAHLLEPRGANGGAKVADGVLAAHE